MLPSNEMKDKNAVERQSRAVLRNVVKVSQPGSDVLLGSILFPSAHEEEVNLPS